ncbi:MAG: extracellular solute-binding protein, partial [Subdoligranulum sp.]|nr:extracellular solute-binding protein [Subdoligranulum sp.]
MAAVLCLALLAGCSSTSSSTPAPADPAPADSTTPDAEPATTDEEVTITVATWDYTSNDSVKNGVEAFMDANPNIKVEILDIPSADYNTKLNTMLNGGSDMDVFFIKEASSTP